MDINSLFDLLEDMFKESQILAKMKRNSNMIMSNYDAEMLNDIPKMTVTIFKGYTSYLFKFNNKVRI